MASAVLHFLIGATGSLAIFLLFTRLSGEQRFSFPSAVLIIGILCAVMAHFLTPWATPALLFLYVLASVHELRQFRLQGRR